MEGDDAEGVNDVATGRLLGIGRDVEKGRGIRLPSDNIGGGGTEGKAEDIESPRGKVVNSEEGGMRAVCVGGLVGSRPGESQVVDRFDKVVVEDSKA